MSGQVISSSLWFGVFICLGLWILRLPAGTIAPPQASMVLKGMGFKRWKHRKSGAAASTAAPAANKMKSGGDLSFKDLQKVKKVVEEFGGTPVKTLLLVMVLGGVSPESRGGGETVAAVTTRALHTYECKLRVDGRITTTQVKASDVGQAKKLAQQQQFPKATVLSVKKVD